MISENIQHIKSGLPQGVRLVCVSKYKPVEAIQEAYDAGERIFGESKAQELCEKVEQLPADIQWHFIGHLQSNKVKYIVPFVSLIHGVDSERLLAEIDKQAAKAGKIVNCLLQVHIAQEESKFGFSPDKLLEFIQSKRWTGYANIAICGLMGMASNTNDMTQVRSEFHLLKTLFDQIKEIAFSDNIDFKELSMGMSDDYKIAVEEGSTLVRIGSAIFGNR
jgi:pyridoxal phosphate enzyme (YggS family)